MQQRPLRMVMAKGKDYYQLPMIWAHGVKGGFRPVLTISAHHNRQGDNVWYFGGQVAEDGVNQNDAELFAATAAQLKSYLPDIKTEQLEWASYYIVRAEGKDEKGWLPDAPIWQERDHCIFAWPTKLTFAPLLADQLLQRLQEKNILPTQGDVPAWQNWDNVSVADYPWDKAVWTKI